LFGLAPPSLQAGKAVTEGGLQFGQFRSHQLLRIAGHSYSICIKRIRDLDPNRIRR
jgi:hypothetical protein